MEKRQLIELVQKYLGGGSAPPDVRKKYSKGVLDLHVGMVFNDYLVRIFQNTGDINNLNSYSKWYLNCSISADSVISKTYINIPSVNTSKILQLPNDLAIREVYLNSTPKVKCNYRPNGADPVYSQLEVNTYLSAPSYSLIGQRIYFGKTTGATTTATVLMAAPWIEYATDEDVPVPFENDQSLFDIIIQRLRQQPPEDKMIDENLNQV